MGFIKSENSKDDDKYILMEDIVLLVQSLDSDKPSLKETARFLLRKYVKNYIDDIPFGYVDEICFIRTITGLYEQANFKRPLLCFLEFVANYDCFDDGISEDNPNWIANNQYSHIYLEKKSRSRFLAKYMRLGRFSGLEREQA